MKRLELKLNGWPCKLGECPPGHFLHKDTVGFKSEYRTNEGYIEAFNEAGEFFWAGAATHEERNKVVVQPLAPVWVEVNGE